MGSNVLARSRFYQLIRIVLSVVLICSLVSTQAWGLFSTNTAYAAAPEVHSLGSTTSLVKQVSKNALPVEPANPLGGMNALGADMKLNGILTNSDATLAAAQHEPSSLANPISVSRVQSAYAHTDAVSDTIIITFTISNNRLPLSVPSTFVSTTLTETISSTLAFDPFQDPNTIHNVLLADTLLSANAVFLSASSQPDHSSESLAWNLGDIPPLDTITATLRVRIPNSIPDFIALDIGATAWGTLQGRAVSASTAPASMVPDGFGDWLKWTVDADYYDQYMVPKAAELGNDWQRMFAYVRSLDYESYKGSLRGTRGTLWSEAGNSLDKASLLIAMLRGSGIPARYRHGTLSNQRAQALILSMFSEPTRAIGHVPSTVEASDPAHDPQLLRETMDHWWVEAYLPGLGWTNLDPCFASSTPGQTFHNGLATDGTDQIAEVPDNLRHKVTITVKVEKWDMLSNLSGGLSYVYPLTHTFNTVELVGNPVALGHLVNSEYLSGMVFYWVRHTYIPYFAVGDFETLIEGKPFQDLISNFPFGTFVTTGEWLLFDVHDTEGDVKHYEREIVDRIGFEKRLNGGVLDISQNVGTEPILTYFDLFSSIVVPSDIPGEALQKRIIALAGKIPEIGGSIQQIQAYLESGSQQDQRKIAELGKPLILITSQYLATQGLQFYYSSSSEGHKQDVLLGTRTYAVSPRVAVVSSRALTLTVSQSIDLLKNDLCVIAAPGQNSEAISQRQILRGLTDTYLEGQIWPPIEGSSTNLSTLTIMEKAAEQNISSQLINESNLDLLHQLTLSPKAKARIAATVNAGRMVIVPEAMVTIGSVQTIAWWEIDTTTWETIGVLEDGTHSGLVDYFGPFFAVANKAAYLVMGQVHVRAVVALINWLYQQRHFLHGMNKGQLARIIDVLTMLIQAINTWGWGFKEPLYFLWQIRETALLYLGDPPLPNIVLHIPTSRPESNSATISVPRQAIYSGNSGIIDLLAPSATFTATLEATWPSFSTNTMQFTAIFAQRAGVYNDAGSFSVGGGTVQVLPLHTTSAAQIQGHAVNYHVPAIGNTSTYAPAVSGLGAGSSWITYTAQLTSTQPYTLELRDVVVTVNGTDTYTGSFTLVTTDTTYIEGSGHPAVPNFADAAYMQANDAHLMIGPANGTFLVGNEPVDASNGLAIASYTGPITIFEETATLDRIELNGDASFFTLATVPTTTVTNPNTPVNFQAAISANFTDTYTTTVEAPEGWNVELDASGLITATPPLGAEPGDYTILVTAQSGTYPDLFASAVHTVTTTDYQGMAMQVNPDPLITVPFGPIDPSALPGDTNNGQMQIPGAAFTIDITNTSTTSHTFAISVNDLPAGWLILSGAEGQTTTTLTLPPGGIGQIGLYISPTLAALPPAHTEYPFTVNATAIDNPALTQSDADVFTVPEIAFSQVKADPAVVYSSPALTTTFDVGLRNVGNTAGSFPLIFTQPISTWTAAINSPLSVGAGQVVTQNVVLNTPNGDIGRDYNVSIAAPSGAYTQTTHVNVQLVGPCVLQVHRTTQLMEQVAGSEGSLGLAAAWQNLTFQLSEFELKPGQAAPRQRVVSATQSVIDHFSTTFPISTTSLQAILVDLADNTTAAEDSATLAAYCSSATNVGEQVKRLTDRAATLVLQPGAATTLLDRPITYTVHLLNRGTLSTTYNLAVEGLDPAWLSASTGSLALEPAQSGAWSFTATPPALGTYPFTVTVTAQEDALVQYHSRGLLRSVDAYVKVLEVAAYPDFVDTGLSHTNLSMQLANQAELSQPALVEVRVTAPDNTPVLTSSVPITLSPYDNQIRRVELGILDTSGFITGVYTIGVTVTDLNGRFMPQGSGFGKFSVGQAISATARVTPQIVAPGNPVITTTIETSLPGSLRMDLNWTRSVETETISAASIGNTADLSRALALPTYSNLVWDNGAIAQGNSHLVPPGHLWASWWQRYGIDMRHFRGTFTLPVGRNITTTDGILASPYYSPTMVPINDNVYIYLNGTRQFYGGTNYPGTPRGVVPETDYWYIPTGARLNGIHEGENVIDIVTEERWGWGALGYLELTLLQPLGDVRYQVDTLHHLPLAGLQVLTETVTPPPTVVEQTAEKYDYRWQHELSPTQRLQTLTFASQLLAMQPGEIRQVSADTIVSYTVASGSNQLHLGPLYVVAPHIIRLEPSSRIVAPGRQATYAVMLYNPALYTDTFRLSVDGLPPEWIDLPTEVALGAGLSQTVTLTIRPSTSTEESDWSFGVMADTGTGGRECVLAELSVRNALQMAVQPKQLAAGNSQTVTYTVAITNAATTFRTYSLTVAGLTENAVTLPATIGVAANTVVTVPLAVTAHAPRGWYPFDVQAAYANGNGVLSAAADAVLMVTSDLGVMATLSPTSGIGGPSVPVLYHLTVTNTGSLSDTYSFNVNLPTGWTYRLEANGSPVTTLSLMPYVFNAAELWLIVTPAPGTVPDTYDFTVQIQSQTEAQAQSLVNGVLNVTERGVQVSISPEHTTMNPTDIRTWQVQVTNTGSVADTFTLMAGGIVSGSAQFAPASVSLAPGESRTVPLTSRDMGFALPQIYPFAVTAQSTSDEHIQNYDTADITFNGYEAAQVELLPAHQTITNSLQASYLMVITNTGNIDTVYRLSANAPSLTTYWEVDEVYIPAHMTAGVLLTVRASGSGVYPIDATACSLTSPAQGTTTADLTVVFVNHPPLVNAGTDQAAYEGEWISFNGSFSDPEAAQTHVVVWDFGDGITTTGTLTPTHLYADNGVYTVTLTVTDNAGGVGQSTLHVTVNNAPPQVNVGVNQTVLEGDVVLFNGTFTDLGAIDTHTIQWDFGDGTTANGVLTPTHVYIDNGVYTATLTVIDKDGGSGAGTVLITVNNVPPTVDAGPDQTVARGQVAYFNGLFTDPGTADTHTITWNFGDGTSITGALAPTHVYANSGVYTATLAVTDDDGGVGSDLLVITVQAIVPTVNVGSDRSVAEGEAVNFTGAFSGTGTLSGFTFTWNFGDGANASDTLTPTHTYADNPGAFGSGVYAVTLNVTDDEGQVGSDTLLVTVTNVAPIVEAGSDENTIEGALVSFNGAFTDPGVLDTHTYHWNFGDGLTASGTLTATHVYTRSGVYTATLTVTDDDGGVGSDVLRVIVAAQPVACALYPIALHASTVASVTIGQALPDVYNGAEQGNFGWLSWTGANGEPVLVNSLMPPGDSNTYLNPNNPNDHTVSINDWVSGRPGVANSRGVRDALDVLKTLTIVVPVWDAATGQGSNTQYRVVGFARIQITSYQLPGQDRITAIYRGPATCQ